VTTDAVEAPPFLCPRCSTPIAAEQEWCLNCGTAARTAIAATPNWRLPLAVLAVVVVLCGAALAWAFVELTNNDAEVRAATAVQTAPAAAPTENPGG